MERPSALRLVFFALFASLRELFFVPNRFHLSGWPIRGRSFFYAKVRFACALSVESANSPRKNFGKAAAPIIAALSVESPGAGKYTGYQNRAPSAAALNPELHATPPDTIMLFAPISSADRAALRSNSSITVY